MNRTHGLDHALVTSTVGLLAACVPLIGLKGAVRLQRGSRDGDVRAVGIALRPDHDDIAHLNFTNRNSAGIVLRPNPKSIGRSDVLLANQGLQADLTVAPRGERPAPLEHSVLRVGDIRAGGRADFSRGPAQAGRTTNILVDAGCAVLRATGNRLGHDPHPFGMRDLNQSVHAGLMRIEGGRLANEIVLVHGFVRMAVEFRHLDFAAHSPYFGRYGFR